MCKWSNGRSWVARGHFSGPAVYIRRRSFFFRREDFGFWTAHICRSFLLVGGGVGRRVEGFARWRWNWMRMRKRCLGPNVLLGRWRPITTAPWLLLLNLRKEKRTSRLCTFELAELPNNRWRVTLSLPSRVYCHVVRKCYQACRCVTPLNIL